MPLPEFIEPCLPRLQAEPPLGPLWTYEVKFDGYRVQVHKAGAEVAVYSRRGADFTRRAGRAVVESARRLPCESCILDGELIALGDDGVPSFEHLHARLSQSLAVVVFDVLALDGRDLRRLPLAERRAHLAPLLLQPTALVASGTFDDPLALLAACDAHGLEGIVCKRSDRPYRSGHSHDWVKVKTAAWRKANADRGKLFEQA